MIGWKCLEDEARQFVSISLQHLQRRHGITTQMATKKCHSFAPRSSMDCDGKSPA